MASNLDEATIYQIFRACRLCGAGGGYKMPIIPSVVGLDSADIQLQQKIRECVQIEVHQDDKMPPLICELCVDKVNDFYEFLEMCQQTNQNTRQRLGLPMNASRAASEVDCILGLTEPVYLQTSDDEPLSRNRMVRPVKVRDENNDKNDKRMKSLKKELDSLISQQEIRSSRESRSSIRDRRDSGSSNSSRRSNKEQQRNNDRVKLTLKRDSTGFVIDLNDDEDSPKTKKTRTEKSDSEPKSLKSKPEAPPEPKTLRSKTETKTQNFGPKSLRSKLETKTTNLEPKSLRSKPENKTQTQDPEPKILRSKLESKTQSNSEQKGLKVKPEKEIKKEKETPVEEKLVKSKTCPQSKPLRSSRPGPKSSKVMESPPPQPLKPTQSATQVRPQRPGPKCSKRAVSPPPASPPPLSCGICAQSCVSAQGLASHLRMHAVKFTPPHVACNPCGEWFLTFEETTAHHKWHKNNHVFYTCRACNTHYRLYKDYERHMSEKGSAHVPWQEVPDVQCAQCCRQFPTRVLLRGHKCSGARVQGGKCSKCNRHYQVYKNLVKHQATCAGKKKSIDISTLKIDPEVRESLLPMQVKVVNCDPLLKGKRQRCDVNTVPLNYGFDPKSIYPYRYLVRVKREPLEFDGMVSINKEIRDEFYKEEDYVHWDSDNSSDSDTEFSTLDPIDRTQKVPSLTALTLKTIYSRRCLGKVPKRLRKVKQDKFDSLFNIENDFDDIRSDVDNIIDNLGLDANKNDDNFGSDGKTIDSIQISETFSLTDNFEVSSTFETTTNLEFDSLKDSSTDKYNESCNTDKDKSKENVDEGSRTDFSLDESEKTSQNGALQEKNDDTNNVLKDNIRDTVDGIITEDTSNIFKDNTDNTNIFKATIDDNTLLKDNVVDSTNLLNDSAVTTALLNDNVVDNTNLFKDNNLINVNTVDNTNFTIESLLESPTVEKNDLALENNLESDLGNNLTEKQNGSSVSEKLINNGTDSNDLISEISELYDKKLMDDLDAEIGL